MERRSEMEPPAKRRAGARRAFDPGLLASPFYSGPTAYGGASLSVKVTPAKPTPAIGHASKRIWDLLAHCSSPLADAKRTARALPPQPPATPSQPQPPRRLRELRQPAMATLLRLKRNNRKVASGQAAIAASLSSSLPFQPADYSLPTDAEPHKNKIRTKINGRSKITDDAPPLPLDLPPAKLETSGVDITFERLQPPPVTNGPTSTVVTPPVFKRFTFRNPHDAKSAIKPADKFIYINMDGHTVIAAPTAAPVSTSDTGFAELIKKQQSQWECDSCLSRNNPSAVKCACCDAPKPGAEPPKSIEVPKPKPIDPPPPPITGPSLMGFVQKQKSQWECECCLTRNEHNRNKCACCEAAKPGSQSTAPAAAANFNFGSGKESTFKFGVDKSDVAPKTATAAPNFLETLNKNQPAPATGFTFGIKPTEKETLVPKESPKAASGFTFPSKKDDSKTVITDNAIKSDFADSTPKKVEMPVFGGSDKKSTSPTNQLQGLASPTNQLQGLASPTNQLQGLASTTTSQPQGFALPVASTTASPFSSLPKFSPMVPSTTAIVQPQNVTPIKSVVAETEQVKPIQAPSTASNLTTPDKAPPVFSFGSNESKNPFGYTSPPAFGFTGSTPASKPSELFSFGSKDSKVSIDTQPKFPSPLTNSAAAPKDIFPVEATTTTASPIPSLVSAVSPKESPFGNPNVSFQTMTDKTKEAPFSFSSATTTSAPTSGLQNAFKTNTPNSMFTFGATPTKTDVPSLPFGSPQNVTPSSIFGAPVSNDLGKTSNNNSIFKSNNPPATTSSFAPATSNIFGSKTPTSSLFGTATSKEPAPGMFGIGSKEQTSGIFGNGPNQLADVKPIPSIFGSNALNPGSPPTGGSIFSNQPPPFNSENMFNSNPAPGAQPTTMFGSPAVSKPGNPMPSDPSVGMFGNKTQPGAFFGSGAPPPPPSGIFSSFTASKDLPHLQTDTQNVPFRFGAPTSTPIANAPAFGQMDPSKSVASPGFSFGGPSIPAAPAGNNTQFNFSMGAPPPAFPTTPGVNAGLPARRYKKAFRRNVPR